ncbi:hypothetical protein K3495_g13134 [Podosphaera aphanis]|nr:hypothetical protein K3495_g13134 [Podosphaera aphanis]
MTDPQSPNAKEEVKPNIDDDCAKYDPSTHTPIAINTWISSFMIEVELAEYFNDDLFEVFNEGFVKFNAAQLKRCGDIILRKLKNFLFDRGVFVRKASISHVKAITEVQEKDEDIWAIDVTNPSAHIGSYKTNNFQSPRINQSRNNVQNYFNKDDTKESESTKIHQTTDVSHNIDSKGPLNFKLTGMSKLYNKSEKFSGDKDESFSFKYKIFVKKYALADISNENDILSSIFLMFN